MLLRSLFVLLVCLSLAFAATPAQAQQVQLAWDAPVQTNGTPVPKLPPSREASPPPSASHRVRRWVSTLSATPDADVSKRY